jgi:hypothetical protein
MAGLLAPTTDDFIPDAPSAGVDDFVPDDDFAPDSEIVPTPPATIPGALPIAGKSIIQGGLEMARVAAGPIVEAAGELMKNMPSLGPSTAFNPSGQPQQATYAEKAQEDNIFEGQTQIVNRAMKPIMESPSLKLPPELQQAEYGQLYQQGDWSNFFKKAIMDTAQMTPQLAGAAAAGVMTGGSAIAAPIAAGTLGALQEGGSFYEQAINEGMDPQEALARSGAFGGLVFATNAIPLSAIGGKVVTRTPFLNKLVGTRKGAATAIGIDAGLEAATEVSEGASESLALQDIDTLMSIPTDPMAIKKVVDDMAMGAYGESGVALPAALSSLLMSAVTRGRASGSRRVMDRARNKPAPAVEPDPSIITGDQAPPVMSAEEARATPVQPPVVPVEPQTGQTQPDIPLGPDMASDAPVEAPQPAPAPRPADIALKARAAEILQSIAPEVAPTPEVATKPKRARKAKPVAAPVEEQAPGGTTALPWSITPEEDAQFLNKEKGWPAEGAPEEYHNKWMVRKLESQIAEVNQISAQAEAKIADWSARVYKKNDGLIEKKDMYGEEAGQQTLTSVNERRRRGVISGARNVIADNEKLLTDLNKQLKNVKSRFPEPEAPAKPFDQAASDAEMLKMLLDEKPSQSTPLDLEGDPEMIPGEVPVETVEQAPQAEAQPEPIPAHPEIAAPAPAEPTPEVPSAVVEESPETPTVKRVRIRTAEGSVITQSTRSPGKFQVTHFAKEDPSLPTGHDEYDNLLDALVENPPAKIAPAVSYPRDPDDLVASQIGLKGAWGDDVHIGEYAYSSPLRPVSNHSPGVDKKNKFFNVDNKRGVIFRDEPMTFEEMERYEYQPLNPKTRRAAIEQWATGQGYDLGSAPAPQEAVSAEPVAPPSVPVAVYNGKSVPMEGVPSTKKGVNEAFKRAARRISDNGAEGYVVMPDGKVFKVSQSTRMAKPVTGPEAEQAIRDASALTSTPAPVAPPAPTDNQDEQATAAAAAEADFEKAVKDHMDDRSTAPLPRLADFLESSGAAPAKQPTAPQPTVTTTTEGAPWGYRTERIELPGDPGLDAFRSSYKASGIRAPKGQSIEDFGLGTENSFVFRKNKGVAADIAIQDAAGLGLLPHDANLEDLANLFRGPAKKVIKRHVPIIHATEGTAEWFTEMKQEKERLWAEIDKSEKGGRKTTKKADALRKELDMLDQMEADAIEKHGPISVLGDVGAEIREQAKEATTKKARDKKPKLTDPRQVGGVYHSDYWNKDYTVLDIKRTPSGAMESVRVQWSDGTTSTSTTKWDKRDRVVSAPPAQAQAQVLLSPEAQSIVDAYGSTEKALAALEHQREAKKQEGGSTTQADRIIKEIRESKQTDLFGQETITGGTPDRGPGGLFDDQTTLPMGQAAPQGDADFDWETGESRNVIDDDDDPIRFMHSGPTPSPSGKREKAKLNDSPADLHVDPNRDPKRTAKNQRMTAEPLSKTFKEKADKFLGELKRRSTRAQEFISNDKSNATTNEMFRLLKANSSRVGTEIGSTLSAILEPLGPNQQKFFQHYLFMKNMQENIKNGGGSPRNGYYTEEAVDAEVDRMDNILQTLPAMKPVVKAIAQRQAVKQEMTEKLQNLGLLPEDTDKEWYWHQQVSSMHELRRIASTNRPNPKKRSFQKARSQSDLRDDKYDINEDYLQSEFEWMFEAGIEIEKELWLRELNKRVGINFKDLKAQAKEIRDEARARVKAEIADIKAQAKLDAKGAGKEMRDQIKKEAAADAAQAREDGIERVRWTDLIPEGYRIWQPSNRSVFKPSHSPVGRFVDNLVEQMQQAEGEEAQKMDAKLIDLTEGSRVFVLPDAVVDQLNKMESKEFSHFRELEQNILRLWKARTLFAPDRIAGYFFRNGLGDYDAMVAGAPGISKKLFAPSTWKEAIDYQKGDTKMSRDWQTAISLGVVDSGQHTVELVNLDELPFFRRFAEDGDSGKGMMGKAFQAYWNSAIGANAIRENAFRYAAFKYYKKHLTNKTLKSYGGSNPEVVDTIAKEMGIDHAAAHLARNLSGDYSNLTEYGEWLRQNLFPFWAFTEINSARTARIFRNTANEGARMGDYLIVGKDGKPIDEAGLGEKASRAVARSLYWGLAMGRIAKVFALTYMFNHLLFPDEEDDLSEEAQNSMHLVLGRRQDGSVRYYSNVGAIATAMDSVGVQQMVGLGMQYANDQLDVQSLLKGLAVATPKAVTNLGVQQLRPDFKAVPEALMGQSSYPDIFNMRAQDSTETLLKVIGGDRMAAWAQGKPLPNFGERMALGTLAKQPAQEAMIDAYRYRDRYLKKIGKSREGIFASDENLRTMRQAVLANDREAFARYKAKYLADGKKYDNFKASVTRLDPLTGIPREDRREFWDYLTEEQATRFNEARRHARDIERTMRIWWRESN